MLAEDIGMYRLRFGEYSAIYTRADERYLALRIGHHREVYGRPTPAIGHLNRCRIVSSVQENGGTAGVRKNPEAATAARKQIIKA